LFFFFCFSVFHPVDSLVASVLDHAFISAKHDFLQLSYANAWNKEKHEDVSDIALKYVDAALFLNLSFSLLFLSFRC
jgi:hypothetical protein